jgi:asparagine synthetase B (glutamine-hydrolysing)
LTLWNGIKQFTPGRGFTINIDDLDVTELESGITWPATERADYTLSLDRQIGTLTGLIDTILSESCPDKDPVILFSGGVDSGTLAVRAAALGWRKTTLVNYCLGRDDKESVIAENMARHLGLDFLQIKDADYNSFEMLDEIANIYKHPFGDHSSLPTYSLSRAVIENFPRSRVIVDGTGADGAFGLFAKVLQYQKLYRIPKIFRMSMGHLYKAGEYWKINSRIEYMLRLCRRTAQMPMLPTSIAQNPLLDIIYHVPPDTCSEVLELIDRWMTSAVPSDSDSARLPALDLALVCSGIYAQKNKSIFDADHRKIVYPFLDSRMVGLALQRARFWPGSRKPKHSLKSHLASHVPPEMVYRPKSGFVAPITQKLSQPEFLKEYDRLLETRTALLDILDLPKMKQLRQIVASGITLPDQTTGFIWATVFANCWLNQIEHFTCPGEPDARGLAGNPRRQ